MVKRAIAILVLSAFAAIQASHAQSEWNHPASDSLQFDPEQNLPWPYEREAQINHLRRLGIHPVQVHYFLEYISNNGTPLSAFEILAVPGIRIKQAKLIFHHLHFRPDRPNFSEDKRNGRIKFMSYWGGNLNRTDALEFPDQRSWRSIQRISLSTEKDQFRLRLQHDPGLDKTKRVSFSFSRRGYLGWRTPSFVLGNFRVRIGQNQYLGGGNTYTDLFRSYQRLPQHEVRSTGNSSDPQSRRGAAVQYSFQRSSLIAWYAIGSQDTGKVQPQYRALKQWMDDQQGFELHHALGVSFQRKGPSSRTGLSLLGNSYGRKLYLRSVFHHFHMFKTGYVIGELYLSWIDPWLWNEQITIGRRGKAFLLYSEMKWQRAASFEWDWAVIKEMETGRGTIRLLLARSMETWEFKPATEHKTSVGCIIKEIGRTGINIEYSYTNKDTSDKLHLLRLRQIQSKELYFTRKEIQLIRQENSWGWAYSFDLGISVSKVKCIAGFNGFSVPAGSLYDFQYGLTYRMDFNPWHGRGQLVYALIKMDLSGNLRLECKASQLSYFDRTEIGGSLPSKDAQRHLLEVQLIWKADLTPVREPRDVSTSPPSALSAIHSPFSTHRSFPAVPVLHSPMER
jgi:hypothetical protein